MCGATTAARTQKIYQIALNAWCGARVYIKLQIYMCAKKRVAAGHKSYRPISNLARRHFIHSNIYVEGEYL